MPCPDEEEMIYRALVLGVRDYVGKTGFKGVVLGLSGGIDSALTLAVAVDALGPEQVEVVLMPSRYTADMSNEDALEQARRMGVKHSIIPIEPAFKAFLAQPGTMVTSVERGIVSGRSVVLVMQPLYRDRELLGYVGLSLTQELLQSTHAMAFATDGARIVTFNQRGEILTSDLSQDGEQGGDPPGHWSRSCADQSPRPGGRVAWKPAFVDKAHFANPRRQSNIHELQKKLNEALQELSEDHRSVVTMFDIQGMPHAEISEILGVSEGTVRSRLYYAHKQLQGYLEEFISPESAPDT